MWNLWLHKKERQLCCSSSFLLLLDLGTEIRDRGWKKSGSITLDSCVENILLSYCILFMSISFQCRGSESLHSGSIILPYLNPRWPWLGWAVGRMRPAGSDHWELWQHSSSPASTSSQAGADQSSDLEISKSVLVALKRVWRKIFNFRFFHVNQFPIRAVSNVYENSRRYSQIFVYRLYQRHRNFVFIVGINDTCVNDTGDKLSPVSDSLQLRLQILIRINPYSLSLWFRSTSGYGSWSRSCTNKKKIIKISSSLLFSSLQIGC